ncbi:MAG: four helix bundle protein [Bacteroidia bacterium]
MKNIPLEDLEIYKMAMEIGEDVWNIVITWDIFKKKTIGNQLVRSSDTIAANIAEGYGRYQFDEKRQFSFCRRASLFETKTWLMKAHNRSFISEAETKDFQRRLLTLGMKLNNNIKNLNNNK